MYRWLVFVLVGMLFVSTAFAEELVKKSENREAAKLEEIVVTATRTEKDVASAPGSVSMLTKSDMEKRNVKTVDNALNVIPGVFNRRQSLMDIQSNVSLRGIPEQKRTLIL